MTRLWVLALIFSAALSISAQAAEEAPHTCSAAASGLAAYIQEKIKPGRLFLLGKEVDETTAQYGVTVQELASQMAVYVKRFSRPVISHYQVGVVALTTEGYLVAGINLEFSGHALNQTVHGEQFAATLATQLGLKGIKGIFLGGAPCGHCRQFLNELNGGPYLEMNFNGEMNTIGQLLPRSFGPAELGNAEAIFTHERIPLKFKGKLNGFPYLARGRALIAAERAYAPYSQVPSGVAIELKNGDVISGSYLENVAFNPSLSPMQAALVSLIALGHDYEDIQTVVLAELDVSGDPSKPSQRQSTHALAKSIAPQARVLYLPLEKDRP